jgi:hypothetical protein
MDSPELRSAIARAVGRCGEAIDCAPSGPHTEAWARAYGRPAMESLHALAVLLAGAPAPRPTAVSVTINCPDAAAHLSTPCWDPTIRSRQPKRPGPVMVVAVRQALADALGRPPRAVEMVTALCAAVGCRTRTAYRALRDSLVIGAIAVADGNYLLPGQDTAERRPPSRARA